MIRDLKITLFLAMLAITAFSSAYATYRVDRHVITTLKRDNRELKAVAADYTDVMHVASMMSKAVR